MKDNEVAPRPGDEGYVSDGMHEKRNLEYYSRKPHDKYHAEKAI